MRAAAPLATGPTISLPATAPCGEHVLPWHRWGCFSCLPCCTMIGAILGASDQNGQFLGAASGLLVGLLGVILVARVLRAAKSPELPKGDAR